MNSLTSLIAQGGKGLPLQEFDSLQFQTSWWEHPVVIVALITFVGTFLMMAGIRWMRQHDAKQEGPLIREVLSHAQLTSRDRALIESIRVKAGLPPTSLASLLISRGFFEKVASDSGVMQTQREECQSLASRLFGS